MLVEALRLIVVLVAVLAANRLATARPHIIGGLSNDANVLVITVLGAGIAYIAGGVLARGAERLLKGTEERIARHHASEIIASTLGFLIGGVIASLFAWPILTFVEPTYVATAIVAFLTLIVLSFTSRLAVRKRLELFGVFGVAPTTQGLTGGSLLDSSAAIDGRVLALFKAGLLPMPLCVPSFIIWELQGIADSGDPMRRRRGQRGLDMLATLREAGAEVRVLDEDPAGSSEPDAKLVIVARRRGLPIVTSDSNLAKAAELQGVGVLSLHRLADLLRPPVLVGERIRVAITRKGREAGQGIGHLDDGSMVIVEGAADRVGDELEVEVTTVLQQDRGRLLFARIADPSSPELHEVR